MTEPTHPAAKRRRSPGWRELALLVASLLVGFVLVEVALRLHHGSQRRTTLAEIAEEPPPRPGKVVGLRELLRPSADRDQVYELVPDLDVRFRGVRVRTNRYGWREGDHELAKPPGTRRIVGLGDSVMFGWGVRERERYLDRFEKQLGKRQPAADWQTWALAVPGYDLAMLVAVLEGFGAALDPDLIVYGWMPNDQCLPSFLVPEPDPWSWTSFIALYLGRDLALPSLVPSPEAVAGAAEDTQSETSPGLDEEHCFPEDVPPELRHRVGRDVLARGLERLARFGREHDVPIVVMKYNHDRLDSLPAELPTGLELVDLTTFHDAGLRRSPGLESDLFLGPHDTHPSPKAHQLLARGLTGELDRRGLLASGPAGI